MLSRGSSQWIKSQTQTLCYWKFWNKLKPSITGTSTFKKVQTFTKIKHRSEISKKEGENPNKAPRRVRQWRSLTNQSLVYLSTEEIQRNLVVYLQIKNQSKMSTKMIAFHLPSSCPKIALNYQLFFKITLNYFRFPQEHLIIAIA